MKKLSRLSGTLYFFPAFLPLVELVPWLLTVLGLVTVAADFSGKTFWQRHRRKIHALYALSLLAAIGYYFMSRPDKDVRDTGTQIVAQENFPKATPTGHQAAAWPAQDETTFKPLWSVTVEKHLLSAPVVSGNVLTIGTNDMTIEAFAAADGQALWTLPLAAPIFTLALESDGRLYAGEGLHQTEASTLTALDPQSGQVFWQRQFLGHIEEDLSLDESANQIFLGAGPSGLWSVSAQDSRLLWHQPLGHIDARPLRVGDTLYIPAQINETEHKTRFYALDRATGAVQWHIDQPGQPWGSPLIEKTGTLILTSTGEGQIGVTRSSDRGWAYGLSRDGKQLWTTELPDMPIQPSLYLASDDLIIHSVKSGDLVALHAKDGTIAWKARVGESLQAPATLMTGAAIPMLAVVSHEGLLSIRDARTGALLALQNVGANSTSSPFAVGDRLYVASAHTLTAFGGVRALAEAQR